MYILIIDDSQLWITHGKELLAEAGHEVEGLYITNPQDFIGKKLHAPLITTLAQHELLLIDKDLGEGITSTRLICAIRKYFPWMPIVRWSGGVDDTPYMRWLGVSTIAKPTKKTEAEFPEIFEKAVQEQKAILSGPMGIYDILEETVTEPDQYFKDKQYQQFWEIAEIAQLAEKDVVISKNQSDLVWGIEGEYGSGTRHELGHCICDGILATEDIRPHLPALQTVIAKMEAADEIDERFRICADFIREGDLGRIELVRRCY